MEKQGESRAADQSEASRPKGPLGGLLHSLRQLLGTLVGIAHTRLELLTTELQEEIERAAVLLVWSFIALFAAGIGLFLAALVVIFAFWDSHRLLVSVIVMSLFFAVAALAGLMLTLKLRGKPRLLDGTLAELERDRERLKTRL